MAPSIAVLARSAPAVVAKTQRGGAARRRCRAPSACTPSAADRAQEQQQRQLPSPPAARALASGSDAAAGDTALASVTSAAGNDSPARGGSSYEQALFNAVNILMGVGLLSVPYALKEGGWAALGVLGALWATTNYTGKLIVRCQNVVCAPKSQAAADCAPLATYEEVGEAAFGPAGRTVITALLYTELLGTCGLFYILAGDHLAQLAPGVGRDALVLGTFAVILPTTWLTDLSALSYVGALGLVSSLGLAGIVVYELLVGTGLPAAVDQTQLLHLSTLPVTFGILAFVFAGHAVFPNIYTSMDQPERYDEMLDSTYLIVGATSLVIGAAGYALYGDGVGEEITLSLPPGPLATAATALIVVNPFTKFALTLDPVARGAEEWLGIDNAGEGAGYAKALRTALCLSALVLATNCPFFASVMSLVGAVLTVSISVVVPSVCYLRLYDDKIGRGERIINYGVIALGAACGVFGTASAIAELAS